MPDYRLKRNMANRYLQDRQAMKKNYTGMGLNFRSHDALATESQGPIQDRTRETLVSSDKVILAARKLLLKGMEEVKQGLEPPNVIRESKFNRFPHLVIISEAIESSVDWKTYWKKHVFNRATCSGWGITALDNEMLPRKGTVL